MRKFLLPALALFAFFAFAGSAAARTDVASVGAKRYVVVFNQPNAITAAAVKDVEAAGGTVIARLNDIGAALATSANPSFIAEAEGQSSIHAVSEDVVLQMIPEENDVLMTEQQTDPGAGPVEPAGPDPQPMPDNLGREQWDKMRMNATLTGSYAVQQGKKQVVVAVLDTGAEVLPTPHVDIAPNLDFARSRSFVTSAGAALPDPNGDPNPAAWDDRNGHGSWCLSAVGAPINVLGISGVAPNVTLVALKVLGDKGGGSFFAVANALVYAGNNKFDVASMSFGGLLRHANHVQALVTILNRAIQYARQNGVFPVASAGNNGQNLDDGEFFRDFVRYPVEAPGVAAVSATGYFNQKAFYSNYSMSKVEFAAPGGSTRNSTGVPGSGLIGGQQLAPYRGLGRVLGAFSAEGIGRIQTVDREEECEDAGGNCSYYAWIQGTSMAAPNAAGVAALVISTYGRPQNDDPWYLSPTSVESVMQQTANNQPCPDFFSAGPGFQQQDCDGNAGHNSFFGKGIVDALKASTDHGS